MKCETCDNEHDGLFGSGRFCSRKCANTRTHTLETKMKTSRSLKGRKVGNALRMPTIIEKKCRCGQDFSVSKSNKKRKFCSVYCGKKYQERKGGGYRDDAGRGKHGYYKGVYCASTYELVYVIYMLDHNLYFERFVGFLEDKETGLKYFPDFITKNNHIVEIKGYYVDNVYRKEQLAKKMGFTIDILYKKDLIYAFKWVEENYEYKKLSDLYGEKHSIEYECLNCKNKFYKSDKRGYKFCSVKCVGEFNIGKKRKFYGNQYTNKP